MGGYKGGKKGLAGAKKVISLRSSCKEEAIDITDLVNQVIKGSGIKEGICFLFVPHTTAALFVNEGYDPSVVKDILSSLSKLVPAEGNYAHLEGNSPAHIKSSLMGVSLLLPIEGGKLSLGRWQSVFFVEFDGPRQREVWAWLL